MNLVASILMILWVLLVGVAVIAILQERQGPWERRWPGGRRGPGGMA